MRNYDKYRYTKFIQKSDVGRGVLVTIDRVTDENVAPEYQAEEIKYVIHFKEDYKPWAPGIETLEIIRDIAGTGNVDEWSGTKLELFVDPDVKFGRKKVGGIRCQVSKSQENKLTSTDADIPDIPVSDESDSPYCPHCGNLHKECSCIPDF